MKKQLALSVLAVALSTTASAVTLNFNNGSGSYSSGGITATVTTTGGSLYYNSTENAATGGVGAVGVGSNSFDGAIGYNGLFNANETLTVTFNQAVHLNNISFTQWENGFDKATLSYAGGSLALNDSGQGVVLLDTFNAGGITLNSFTLTPTKNGVTAFYLGSVDVTSAVPVPGAAWLMGSSLAGLVGFARRKKLSK